MRKFFFLVLCMPIAAFAQNKNVINSTRVFPKADRIDQFEKAMANHAQKYHKGDWAWRVFYIETGPDAGGYQFVEGPNTWASIDGRSDLGEEHTKDWLQTVAVHLTDRTSNLYLKVIDSLSTTPASAGTEKIIITHISNKLGYGAEFRQLLSSMRKAWIAGKQNIVVYQKQITVRGEYAIVERLKEGLKEMEDNFTTPFKPRYEAANGAGSWKKFNEALRTIVDENVWSELLVLQPKLGSLPMK